MNFFTFLITRTLVANKTGDDARATQLALATSFMPGSYGMMMGVLIANNEPAPAKKADSNGTGVVALERTPGPSPRM